MRVKNEPECAVCYAAHDDEIHEATLRIHRWFYEQVTRYLPEDVLPELAMDRAS